MHRLRQLTRAMTDERQQDTPKCPARTPCEEAEEMHPRLIMAFAERWEIERRRECQQRQLLSQLTVDHRRGSSPKRPARPEGLVSGFRLWLRAADRRWLAGRRRPVT